MAVQPEYNMSKQQSTAADLPLHVLSDAVHVCLAYSVYGGELASGHMQTTLCTIIKLSVCGERSCYDTLHPASTACRQTVDQEGVLRGKQSVWAGRRYSSC